MDGDALSYGTCGSLIANLLLLAVMENVSEPTWRFGYGRSDTIGAAVHLLAPVKGWQPFIDESGWGEPRRTHCPEPRARRAGGPLPFAPLPSGYDPFAPLKEPFHACLLVDAGGSILSARLLGSSGSARTDGRMLALITTQWRAAGGGAGEAPAWQLVRLNAGPDEGEAVGPPMLE
ncbi:MAG TPA: hypothetical protein VGB70_05820 [Allosphingosinicella sp.]|jgi:hypothetical protein